MSPQKKIATPRASGDGVFRVLLDGIVSGRYPAGTNLPAERDLARSLGASRATLREALRRLEQWNLIAARRGSGVVVKTVATDATVDVLPAYLRAAPGPTAARVIVDLLTLRRRLVVEVTRLLGGRLPPGSLASARAATLRAYAARHDYETFVREDFRAMQSVAESASFRPAVWLLNSLRPVYVELASELGKLAAAPPPDGYRQSYFKAFDALERGDGDLAAETFDRYLVLHDRRLFAVLGVAEGAAR